MDPAEPPIFRPSQHCAIVGRPADGVANPDIENRKDNKA